MTKIVINVDYGGFGLGEDAKVRYCELKGISEKEFRYWDVKRDDPMLIQVVEELGASKASGKYASLKIVDIPDYVRWEIVEYDGSEHIAEEHQKWY